MDVYGYVTAETAAEIGAMSWLRCAQDTANLTRAKADKDALMRARAELRELHRILFGYSKARDAEKLADIATYDARRVQTELRTLRRMREGRRVAAREAQAVWKPAQSAADGPDEAMS
jgi:beta-galactosidase/beta-glucuronidase